jgi:FkbM family methyltransferase
LAKHFASRLKNAGAKRILFAVDPPYLSSSNGAMATTDLDALYSEYNLILGFNNPSANWQSFFKNANFYFPANEIEGLPQWISREYLSDNIDAYSETMSMLKDDFSKDLMYAYIADHIRGCVADSRKFSSEKEQYFTDEFVKPHAAHVFLDCGAYAGDTIKKFDAYTSGSYRKIVAFEPDADNFIRLQACRDKLSRPERVELINKGVSDFGRVLRFKSSANLDVASEAMITDDGDTMIEVVKIDDAVLNLTDPVTMIKMDVEGYELSALKGARETIVRDKPVLAVCVYHKRQDLFTIPQYIKSLVPEYDLSLRIHSQSLVELVLYAYIRP